MLTSKNIIIVTLIVFCIVSMRECMDWRQVAGQATVVLDSVNQRMSYVVDEAGKTITYQNQVIVSRQKDIDRLTEENAALRKVQGQVKWKTKTNVERDTIEVGVPVYIWENDTCLQLPYTFQQYKKWYGYKFTINSQVTIQDSLYFLSEPTLTIGYKKKKWYEVFKEREKIVTLQDSNPFIQVTDLSNIFIEKPKKRVSLGLQAGYGLTKGGLGPYVGVGLNYNLF